MTSKLQRQQDDLRLRIERQRRRIECRFRAVEREGRRLRSWRTYAGRYPAQSAGLAVCVGMVVAAGLRGVRSAKIGRWLVSRSITDLIQRLLKGIWREGTRTRKESGTEEESRA